MLEDREGFSALIHAVPSGPLHLWGPPQTYWLLMLLVLVCTFPPKTFVGPISMLTVNYTPSLWAPGLLLNLFTIPLFLECLVHSQYSVDVAELDWEEIQKAILFIYVLAALHGLWDLPGPGLESMSPTLAGGFLTTEPPGKSLDCDF